MPLIPRGRLCGINLEAAGIQVDHKVGDDGALAGGAEAFKQQDHRDLPGAQRLLQLRQADLQGIHIGQAHDSSSFSSVMPYPVSWAMLSPWLR